MEGADPCIVYIMETLQAVLPFISAGFQGIVILLMALAYNLIREEQKKKQIRSDLKEIEKSFRMWGIIVLSLSLISGWVNVVIASIFLPVDEVSLGDCERALNQMVEAPDVNQNTNDWKTDAQRVVDLCRPMVKRVAKSVRAQ